MWSLRVVVETAVQHGRRALQQVQARQPTLVQQTHSRPQNHASHKLSKCRSERAGGAVRRVAENGAGQSVSSSLAPASPSNVVTRLVQGFVRKVSAPLWTDARRRATKRLVFGENAPFFALVGVTLVSGSQQGLVTKEDELEALCCNIRDAIFRAGWLHSPEYWQQQQAREQEPHLSRDREEDEHTISLASFRLGPVIGKGCNAAVYAARWESAVGDGLHSPPSKRQRSESPEGCETDILEEEQVFTLAAEDLQESSVSDDNQSGASDGYTTALSLEDITRRLGNLRDSDNEHLGASQLRGEQKRVNFKLMDWKRESRGAATNDTTRGAVSKLNTPATNDAGSGSERSLEEFPLAVKMMFNYEAESNAPAILRAMYKELLPARCVQFDQAQLEWQERLCGKMTHLPPHPNIVEMPFVFVDRVPLLEDCMNLYPNALPSRLNPAGYGRNMSLFCIMKRYDLSLREYLSQHRPSDHTSLLLLTQLLEALLHLNIHYVAHRDLKSDNILLSLSEGWDYPLLVLTDFGCSIASDTPSISVPFHSREADPRQGNPALMAPEIITAVPGLLRSVHFSHSDMWAAGAVAYEIYGQENPFNGSQQEVLKKKTKGLESATYKESQLPRMAKSVPAAVKHLVHDLLRRNPRNRPSMTVAATLCQLILWAPSKWLCRHALTLPTHSEIMQWLLCLTTKVLCEARLSSTKDGHARTSGEKIKRTDEEKELGGHQNRDRQGGQLEYQLVSTFLGRVHYSDIIQAIKWNRAF